MFTVSLDGREDIVLMVDKPTQVIVSKKAITGDNELPGGLYEHPQYGWSGDRRMDISRRSPYNYR